MLPLSMHLKSLQIWFSFNSIQLVGHTLDIVCLVHLTTDVHAGDLQAYLALMGCQTAMLGRHWFNYSVIRLPLSCLHIRAPIERHRIMGPSAAAFCYYIITAYFPSLV